MSTQIPDPRLIKQLRESTCAPEKISDEDLLAETEGMLFRSGIQFEILAEDFKEALAEPIRKLSKIRWS